jgi:signal transduction histidine kinase
MQIDELYVEIVDNGVGISDAIRLVSHASEGGVGLISIRERAAELGGRSQIVVAEGGGTRVAAWLPLQFHTDGSVTE